MYRHKVITPITAARYRERRLLREQTLPRQLRSVVWFTKTAAGMSVRRTNGPAETVRNDPRELTPLFRVGPSGQEIVDDWATGFLHAVHLSPDAWRPVFENDDAFVAILPLLLAAQDAEAVQNITETVQRETLRKLPELLPACIEHMRDTRNQHANAAGSDNATPTKY